MIQKESLVAIFQRLYRKYNGKFDEPDPNKNGFFEMIQAANEYVSSLLPLGKQWVNAVVYDVDSLKRNSTIPPTIRYNKERLDTYMIQAEIFVCKIKVSLRHHGFDIMELPKETLAYMEEEAFVFDKKIGAYKSIHPKEFESRRLHRKAAKKNAEITVTKGGNTQYQPPASIIADCISNGYRNKADIIEQELKKALKDKKAKAAIIVFVACYMNGILRQCPSHQQALDLSPSIGESHKGYNDQKKKYFSESEEGKRCNGNNAVYDTLNEDIDIIRESILTAEADLQQLFEKLGIEITPKEAPNNDSLNP